MRIGAVLSPVAGWPEILEAAEAADAAGLDAVGFWDHYHSARPEWAYVCGWSAYGALSARTDRVRLVPMVLNNLHYELGVVAKESSILSIASGGRFELGIGAGDWPESFTAWGRPYPDAPTRVALLAETVEVLRRVWSGDPVTHEGTHLRLRDATCTPAPPAAPRVVVGVGRSRRTLEAAVGFADELNLYDEPALIGQARELIGRSGRAVTLSVFADWSWDQWPPDPPALVSEWRQRGIERALISIGSDAMPERVRQLAALA